MAILPLIFLIQPLIQVFTLPPTASEPLRHEHVLLYMLGIPVLVPAAVAAYSVVGERLQGTLEPLLSTPLRRDELLLGKALAAFVPSVAIAYAVFALFLVLVELFAREAIASALIRGPELVAQVVFTPLLATWSIWIGIAVSARSSDPRIAGQLALLFSLPTVAVTSLIAFNVIPATPWHRHRGRCGLADPRSPRRGGSRQPCSTANDSSPIPSDWVLAIESAAPANVKVPRAGRTRRATPLVEPQ
jgi:ABC-type transport system involved in multi-copper enzyme maturation permease subunit